MDKSYQEQNIIERLLSLILGGQELDSGRGPVSGEDLMPMLDPHTAANLAEEIKSRAVELPNLNKLPVKPIKSVDPYRGGGVGEILSYLLGQGGANVPNTAYKRTELGN